MSKDMLGPSKHAAPGKTTRKESDSIGAERQLVEVPLIVKTH